jgi:RHS repeat-associated protein
MQLACEPNSGDITSTTLGVVTTDRQANRQGELASYLVSHEGSALYSEEILARDEAGRITLRRETVRGTAMEYGYVYDETGRLSEVSIDGAWVRRYDYDANGNRTARVSTVGSENCTYDAQDRLVSCGETHYAYNLVGQLSRQTVTSTGASSHYDYDVYGNLRGVVLPDGRHIEYEIDARNRRIGKRVDGVRQYGLLYQSNLAPVAQLDAHNAVLSTFIYTTRHQVPDYMVRDGKTYRFVVDHIGSLRMIVNVSTGAVAQQIEYDELGRVLSDSNPGFQPFGFAGGLYDAGTGLVRFGARDYDAVAGRWTAKDPILFEGGTTNLYEYVNGNPTNLVDPSGLDTYQCTAPLHALGGSGSRSGPDVPGNPLYHEYLCVEDDDSGESVCGGQDRSGGPWSPGRPSNDRFNAGTCRKIEDDSACFDSCVRVAFGQPRPYYGLVGPGTNCQEWVGEVVAQCQQWCSAS